MDSAWGLLPETNNLRQLMGTARFDFNVIPNRKDGHFISAVGTLGSLFGEK